MVESFGRGGEITPRVMKVAAELHQGNELVAIGGGGAADGHFRADGFELHRITLAKV